MIMGADGVEDEEGVDVVVDEGVASLFLRSKGAETVSSGVKVMVGNGGGGIVSKGWDT